MRERAIALRIRAPACLGRLSMHRATRVLAPVTFALALLAALLLASGVAGASTLPSPPYTSNAACTACHDVSATSPATSRVDFSVGMDFTRCNVCHWASVSTVLPTGGTFSHSHALIPSWDGPCQGLGCHVTGQSSPNFGYWKSPYGGYFRSSASLSFTPAQIHAIHLSDGWMTKGSALGDTSYPWCKSCHVAASCSSCHGASASHASHAQTLAGSVGSYAPVTMSGAGGFSPSSTSLVVNVTTGPVTCAAAACHTTAPTGAIACAGCHADKVTGHGGLSADTTPPTTTSDALSSYQGSATVSLVATDPGGWGVRDTFLALDADPFTRATRVVVAPPTSGSASHTLSFYSVDAADNTETARSASFVVFAPDTAPPVTTSDAVPSYNGDAHIGLVATDPPSGTIPSGVASTRFRIDGGAWQSGLSVDVGAPASGAATHTISFYSVDKAANTEGVRSATFRVWARDTTPPSTTSDARSSYLGTATITLSASDGTGSGVASTRFSVDGGAEVSGTRVVVPSPPQGGGRISRSVTFYSVDALGNTEGAHTITFTQDPADLTAPTTTSDAVDTYPGSAQIRLYPTDAGGSGLAATYFTLDSGARQSGTLITVAGPTSGSAFHTLVFWSADGAGNVEAATSITFVIRATALPTPPFTSDASCAACHDQGAAGPTTSKTDFSSSVDLTRCATCHWPGIERALPVSGGTFTHGHASNPLGWAGTCTGGGCHQTGSANGNFGWWKSPYGGYFRSSASLLLKASQVHAIHSRDGWMTSGAAIGDSAYPWCKGCHLAATCDACHTPSSTHASHAQSLASSVSSYAPVTMTGAGGFSPSDTASKVNVKTVRTTCAASACHTTTPKVPACASCHPDKTGIHGYVASIHTSSQGGVVEAGNATCSDCHSMDLSTEHARASSSASAAGCTACHPTPRNTIAVWDKSCSQGGCHASGGVSAKHGAFASAHALPADAPTTCFAAGCHQGASDLASLHATASTTTAGGTRTGCLVCHSASSVPQSAECSSCHDVASPHPDQAARHAPLSANANCTAGGCHADKDLTQIHSSATTTVAGVTRTSCSVCHADGTPASRDCTSCHGTSDPHDDLAVAHPASDATSTACAAAGCHDTTDVTKIHAARPEGRCFVCHANPTKGDLTSGRSTADCDGCHTKVGVDYHMNMGVHIAPASDYDTCGHCHHGWGSYPGRGPDVTRHASCSTCHNANTVLPTSTACENCHIQNGTDFHTQQADFHTPTDSASLACAACHKTTDVRALHKTNQCATCHVTYNCNECHSMHGLDSGPGLTIKTSCSGCHTTEGTNYHTGIATAHTPPASSSSCLTGSGCHAASDLATLHSSATTTVAGETRTGCMVCHADGTPAGKECSSCHTAVGVDYHLTMNARHTSPTTSSCFGAGCHDVSRDLAKVHDKYVGTGAWYSQYSTSCALCHQNADPNRIDWATVQTSCTGTCHGGTTHSRYSAKHTISSASSGCTSASCHGTDLTGIHNAYSDMSRCGICHNDKTNWSKTSDCISCHAPSDYHGDISAKHASAGSACYGTCHAAQIDSTAHLPSCSTCHAQTSGLVRDAINGNKTDCTACHRSASSYADASGQAYVLVGAQHDGVQPVITSVVTSYAAGPAYPTVTWTTDRPCTTWVDYSDADWAYDGENFTGYQHSVGSESLSTTHSATFPAAAYSSSSGYYYYYRIRTVDPQGHVATTPRRVYYRNRTQNLNTVPSGFEPDYASLDTNLLTLSVVRSSGSRATTAPLAGWESQGASSTPPTPSNPGAQISDTRLAAAQTLTYFYNSTSWLQTKLATTDGAFNWQLMKYQLDATALSSMQGLEYVWVGYAENSEGRPMVLYAWNFDTQTWERIDQRQSSGIDAETKVVDSSDLSQHYCERCHASAPVSASVTVPSNLTNIRTAYDTDYHGIAVGSGAGGSLKAPYVRGQAALACDACHDPNAHGSSANPYKIRSTVNGTSIGPVTTGADAVALCQACHAGTPNDFHASCVSCHQTAQPQYHNWTGNAPMDFTGTDCLSCHKHGKTGYAPGCHGCHNQPGAGPWTTF